MLSNFEEILKTILWKLLDQKFQKLESKKE
jgi:hypothetical protein